MPDEVTTLVQKIDLLAARIGQDMYNLKQSVVSDVTTKLAALKAEILGGANEAYDTLKEIEDFLKGHDDVLAAIQALKIVKYDAQTLTDGEKTQARTNIGAAAAADLTTLAGNVVLHSEAQSLGDSAKAQARTNIGAASAADLASLGGEAVKFTAQTLQTSEQTQARSNINAANESEVVKHVAQTLDATAQTQARTNIGAASASDLSDLTAAVGAIAGADFVSTFNGAYNPANAGA